MKLALVALHIEPSPRAIPLGPAMLASALRKHMGDAVQTVVLDAFIAEAPEDVASRILATDPDLVGFSMYVWNRGQALAVAALLKARRPSIVVLAGGAEATADQAGVLADPSVDIVLPGEGEDLLAEACRRLLQGATPEAIAAWAHPMPVKDLATLPSPYLDGTLDPGVYGGALWELSRGCPFACDFCFESRGTAGVRRIPLARAEAELERFAAQGVREVFVLDPTFNYHKAQAKEILRLIASRELGIPFFFEVRSEFLDREMAELFASFPCTLQIGLQSAHDAVLRNIGRSFNPLDFEAKLLLLHQAGVPYGLDLIYGLPGDTLEGFRESVDFAMSLVPNHLDVFRLSVLPGTRLWETASALGLQYEHHHPYRVLAAPGFSPEDLERAGRIARGCDVLYNHGKAVPWFGMLQEALGIRPSNLFAAFAAWLESQGTEDLIVTQQGFFQAQFGNRGEAALGRVAADIIACFGHVASLLDGEVDRIPPTPFHRDPQALMALLEAGCMDLEALHLEVPEAPCTMTFRMEDGELCVEPFTAL